MSSFYIRILRKAGSEIMSNYNINFFGSVFYKHKKPFYYNVQLFYYVLVK